MAEVDYFSIAQALFAARPNVSWHNAVRHVLPELIPASNLQEMEDDGLPKRICARARTDIYKLASAHTNYITPRGQAWFKYVPPVDENDELSDDEREWYSNATRRVRDELEASNFYTVATACIIDRCATGTGLMMVEESSKGGLHFSHIEAGTYALAENEEHQVDTVVYREKFTAHQARAAFGENALSSQMIAALSTNEAATREFEVWHLCIPRDVPNKGNAKLPAMARQWAKVYIDPVEKHILQEGGYYEFPFMATRFLKYGNQVYGTSVLAGLEDVIGDYISTNEILKVAGQRLAMPSIMAPASMVGEIDLRGGGITVLRPDVDPTQIREFAPANRYDIGIDLLERYGQEIDEATFISVIQTFTNDDRPKTATEVQAIESERMMTFSQSFSQFVSDMQPIMDRIFCLAYRLGKLPANEPPGVMVKDPATGGVKVLSPKLSYIGIMSKALKRAEYQGAINAVQSSVQLAQILGSPEPIDWANIPMLMRLMVDEEMVPEGCIRSADEIKAIQKQREEAQRAAQEAAMMQQMAAANRDNASAQLSASQAEQQQAL